MNEYQAQCQQPTMNHKLANRGQYASVNRFAQQGASMPATLIMVALAALVVTSALKMVPVYIENWQLQTILADIETEYNESGEAASKEAIRLKMAKRMNIDQIKALSYNDIEISRDEDQLLIEANYETRLPLVGNIDVVLKFENNLATVPYRG